MSKHSLERDDPRVSPMILRDPLRTKLCDGLKSTNDTTASTLREIFYPVRKKNLKLPFGYQDGKKTLI